jgi:hypothetical protein
MSTYAQKSDLAKDAAFLGRCAFAVAKFADYILSEAENTANHRQRFRWAQSAAMNPAGVASAIALAVTLNNDVDYGLGNVLDEALQTAVEQACAKLLFT